MKRSFDEPHAARHLGVKRTRKSVVQPDLWGRRLRHDTELEACVARAYQLHPECRDIRSQPWTLCLDTGEIVSDPDAARAAGVRIGTSRARYYTPDLEVYRRSAVSSIIEAKPERRLDRDAEKLLEVATLLDHHAIPFHVVMDTDLQAHGLRRNIALLYGYRRCGGLADDTAERIRRRVAEWGAPDAPMVRDVGDVRDVITAIACGVIGADLFGGALDACSPVFSATGTADHLRILSL
jgi:hypothetical protein